MKSLRALLPYPVLVGAWALFSWRLGAPHPADRLAYPPGDFSQQFGVFRAVVDRALAAGHLLLSANWRLLRGQRA